MLQRLEILLCCLGPFFLACVHFLGTFSFIKILKIIICLPLAPPFQCEIYIISNDLSSGNKNKGKGNDSGLVWESQSHFFVQTSSVLHMHTLLLDTQYYYSQGNCRTMSSIRFKLEQRVVYCKLSSNYSLCMTIWLIVLT